jgi:hypothetical protein
LATQTQLGKVMIPTQIIYWVQLQMYHKREKNMLIENSHATSGTFFSHLGHSSSLPGVC